jgi:hypothetical protein
MSDNVLKMFKFDIHDLKSLEGKLMNKDFGYRVEKHLLG